MHMYPAVIGIIAYIQLVDRQKIRGTEKQACAGLVNTLSPWVPWSRVGFYINIGDTHIYIYNHYNIRSPIWDGFYKSYTIIAVLTLSHVNLEMNIHNFHLWCEQPGQPGYSSTIDPETTTTD